MLCISFWLAGSGVKCQRSCKRSHSLSASPSRRGWRGIRQHLSRASPHGIAPARAGARRPRPMAREARRQPADGDRRLLRGARLGPAAASSSAGAQRAGRQAQRRPGPRRATPAPPGAAGHGERHHPPGAPHVAARRWRAAVAGGGHCYRPARSPRWYLSPPRALLATEAAAGPLACPGPAPSAGPPLRLLSDFPAAHTTPLAAPTYSLHHPTPGSLQPHFSAGESQRTSHLRAQPRLALPQPRSPVKRHSQKCLTSFLVP